jgi:hypothetical protein
MKYKLKKPKIEPQVYDIDIPVFDLSVADDHSYTVGEECIIAHNCRTRQYTGFGSDLNDFVEACDHSKIDLMFDGGLTILDEEVGEIAYGDIYKALNIGAKWVMSSSLFRWSHELSIDGYNHQYGNSTAKAKGVKRHEEGAVKCFKSQYNVEDQMRKIKEHLQSSISYDGKSSLYE